MRPSDLQPHLDAIADAYGLDDPLHRPAARGIVQLVEDIEATVRSCNAGGKRFSLFVIRADDAEAVVGLRKIVTWAKKQKSGK